MCGCECWTRETKNIELMWKREQAFTIFTSARRTVFCNCAVKDCSPEDQSISVVSSAQELASLVKPDTK